MEMVLEYEFIYIQSHPDVDVSILLLMEMVLELLQQLCLMWLEIRFNPSSNGNGAGIQDLTDDLVVVAKFQSFF